MNSRQATARLQAAAWLTQRNTSLETFIDKFSLCVKGQKLLPCYIILNHSNCITCLLTSFIDTFKIFFRCIIFLYKIIDPMIKCCYKFPLFTTCFLLNLWFWSKFKVRWQGFPGHHFRWQKFLFDDQIPLWESKSDLTLEASRSSSSCMLLSSLDKRCSSFKSKASGPFLCNRFWSLVRVFKMTTLWLNDPITSREIHINLKTRLKSSNCFCNSVILECRSFCARLLCNKYNTTKPLKLVYPSSDMSREL